MRPHPKYFTTFDDFSAAFVAAAIQSLPADGRYDDHATAQKKRRAIAVASAEAAEEAVDLWADYVERMEELYERGIGPAWD